LSLFSSSFYWIKYKKRGEIIFSFFFFTTDVRSGFFIRPYILVLYVIGRAEVERTSW
jgi:hypothetical protein